MMVHRKVETDTDKSIFFDEEQQDNQDNLPCLDKEKVRMTSDNKHLYKNLLGKIYVPIKRFFDIILGIVGCVILVILIFFIAPFFCFGKNKGPIFYSQERLGKDGKYFKLYKFRSMIVDADQVLKKNPVLYKEYVENDYKLPFGKDPRITRLGHFLRRSSIDEFPQFFNVVKGDMSIVGPRPIVPEELYHYGDKSIDFKKMKPGIFGVWQASGRSNIKYPERCDLELSYLYNKGFLYDIKMIFITIKNVIIQKGAY